MSELILPDGETLYYEEHGTGRPLMMVAGLGGIGAYWAPQIAPFSKQFRVILHDHRGTGGSSRSQIKYSVEQMAEDTLALMDALDIEQADFIGHSTGAAIAQVIALDHPDRLGRIILASGWTTADGFFRRCFETRKQLLMTAGPEAYIKATPLFLHPSWWIRDNIDQIESGESGVYGGHHDVGIMASRIDALLAFDRSADLPKIPHQVLVMGVANDHLTPAYFSEALAAAIPNASLSIMQDGAHAASQILPDEFNAIAMDFLKGGHA
ncbi:putative aminoacrylate hydrolase RutD [Antarctobacter heliothermus]|uniref:Putative aminoacrylate hydrolase RutD n=1 Tax=Antarctobacter heliothermus TaxID=74033 RepID=A0A222E4U5_9RHOB|nr:alpha/beta fold hydrolase [Antarctobacter heliothermus]ASP21239.1 putative aminoacrylate hydrolase RutD [Antarctobacter heliothermus]